MADRVTPRPATRRQVLRLAGVGIVGAGIGWFARGPGTPDWIDVGRVDALLARIEVEGWAPAPSADGDPAQAVVRWDPSVVRSDGLRSQIVYASEPVVDTTVGLMVLVLRSSQGGCATPFCPSSGLFEDACFGSRFNGWGEWMGGPAPRSLDRRPSRVVGGRLEVSRTGYTIGAARDFGVHAQEPAGPSCSEL